MELPAIAQIQGEGGVGSAGWYPSAKPIITHQQQPYQHRYYQSLPITASSSAASSSSYSSDSPTSCNSLSTVTSVNEASSVTNEASPFTGPRLDSSGYHSSIPPTLDYPSSMNQSPPYMDHPHPYAAAAAAHYHAYHHAYTPYPHYGYPNVTSPPASHLPAHLMPLTGKSEPETLDVDPNSYSTAVNAPMQGYVYDVSGQSQPPGVKPRVTATLWEDEGSVCFQVEAKGVCVARREGTITSLGIFPTTEYFLAHD